MVYYLSMHNWSVATNALKKDKKQYSRWRLESLVNFGLGKTKLRSLELKKQWANLRLDPKKKKFIELLLWP